MDALQREYDRFGPWALELSEADPPPRLFGPYLTRSEAPLLGLKIPRHVERRNVRAGTDLYDYVVALYDDELLVLQRTDGGVAVTTCRIGDIRHVRVGRTLLSGNVHVGLSGASIDLPYNTVSETLMQRFAALIRARYVSGPVALAASPTPGIDTDGLSFYFQRFLEAEARARSPMRLIAAQATMPAAATVRGRARRLLFSLADKRLLESMHASDGRELRVLTRGQAYAYRWESVYGLETTWIPLANVRSVTWRAEAAAATESLVLDTGGGDCTFVFDAANPAIEPYRTYLQGLTGLKRDAAAVTRLAA